MEYSIEEVALPVRKRTARLTYPINSLTPGSLESFVVPVAESVKKTSASVRMFARRNGFKVAIRDNGTGDIRIWRTE